MKENWKQIPGWEGKYLVSNFGNVYSIPRIVIRSNGRPYPIKGCLLKPSRNSNNYRCITLQDSINDIKITLPIYQLVMLAFKGSTPKGLEILHGSKGKGNDYLHNLSFGTHRQNCLDMLRDGLPSAKPVWRSDNRIFPSINSAARDMKINVSHLSQAIHNNWHCKGYRFKFIKV